MLLWSSSFIALKHVLGVWGFGQVLFMRMSVAALCWLCCYRYLGNFRYQQGDWRWLALMGRWSPVSISCWRSTPCATPVPVRPAWSVPCCRSSWRWWPSC